MSAIASAPATAAAPAASAPARATPAAPPTPSDRPPAATAVPAQAPPRDSRELQRQLDELLAPTTTRLRFKVIEELGTVAITIIDERTGEVLRQVPSETALRIARQLRDGRGLLDERA